MPGWLQVYNNKAACSCPSSLSKFGGANLDKELGQLRAAVLQALSVLRPDSRQAPIPCASPRAGTRTWTRTWTRNLDKFYHVFSSCRATCPSSPEELGQGTWTTAGCRVTSSLSVTPRFQAGPDSTTWPRAETRTWTRTWTRNLDKFYHVFSSCRATCPSSPGNLDKELGQLRAAVLQALSVLRPDSRQAPIPCASPLSLEGVSQMDSILPERLPALVRPAFDLVLRRIRSLKRCVQACGCKIMTPRYAPQFGSRLHFKRCQPLPKETPFPFFSGTPFLGLFFSFLFFSFFWFFLSPAKVGSLELQPGAKLQAYLGVIILQPHACTQRFRL